MNNIEVNSNAIKNEKKGFNLRRIKATFLVVASSFVFTACGTPKAEFAYDNSGKNFSTQYEDQYGVDLSNEEEDITNKLVNYTKALDAYEAAKKNKSEDLISKRVNLVSETRKLSDLADSTMKEKIKEALNLTNENVDVYRTDAGQGEYIDVINVTKDGLPAYNINDQNFPKDFSKLLNYSTKINQYAGTGESQAWDNDINKFNENGINLYNGIIEVMQKDYQYDGNSITLQETKQR